MRLLTLGLLSWILCGCYTTRLQNYSRPPTGDELLHDLGHQDVIQAHVLAFLSEVDDRPLYVEKALVAFELPNDKWRMAHVYRHPKEQLEHFRVWQITVVLGAYCVGSRDFDHLPTKSEAEKFIRDSWWSSHPDDRFQLIRRDDFPETWMTVFGYIPQMPRE